MPLIKVQTSIAPATDQVETLLKTLSAQLAKHTGKPESYVMTLLESGLAMTFAGTTEPVCYIEIKSIGAMSPAQTQTMSQAFCQTIHDAIAVPTHRIYIEFADAKGYQWGWNSSTFG